MNQMNGMNEHEHVEVMGGVRVKPRPIYLDTVPLPLRSHLTLTLGAPYMPARPKGSVTTGHPRVTAPPSLAEGPAKVFAQIVSSVDPTHFSDVDLPLLEAYANAAHLASEAAAEIERTGAVIDGKASPWLGVQEKAAKQLVALSARLRICPQSRFDRLVAGANSRPQRHGRKPWEFEGKDDPAAEFFDD